MLYRVLAVTVVCLHLGFILFVATGALLTWRWPRLAWAHVVAVAWGAATLTVGLPCPLTAVEKELWRRSGDNGYEGGFVDQYLEDAFYPDEYSPVLHLLAAAVIVAGYAGLRRRRVAARHAG